MNIVFIYPDIQTIQFYHYHQGLGAISSFLKQAGHSVSLIYLEKEVSEDEVVKAVKASGAELVGFSTSTLQYVYAKRYAKAIKENLKVITVGGWVHSTIAPEQVLKDGMFDFVIRGEGEYPLLELVESFERDKDYRHIKNLCYQQGGEIRINPVREPLKLDELPFVDRDLFDDKKLLENNDSQVSMLTSRGCPYSCTYCCNTVFSQMVGGNKYWVRQRSVSHLMKELELVHIRYPQMKSIIFMDEVFTINRRWVNEFCDEYSAKFKTPFQIFLRVETIDFDMLKKLKDAGLYSIIVGVEAGNERIRREVLGRNMTNEEIERVFRYADELGIETWDFNMIGVPGETEETIRETMELNRRIFPHHVQVSIFYPFPGTPIYERCKREGLLPVEETTSVFHNKPTLNLPTISRERLSELFSEFRALGWLLEAKKSAKGYIDLTAEFDRAEIKEGNKGFVGLWLIRIKGQDRLSILIHPPSRVSYKVKLKKNSFLKFGMAFSPEVWDKPGEGCFYRVLVKSSFRKKQVVFERYFDPKHQEEERGWVDVEVDLSRFGSKEIKLTLETATRNTNEYCVALWSRPHLIQKGE